MTVRLGDAPALHLLHIHNAPDAQCAARLRRPGGEASRRRHHGVLRVRRAKRWIARSRSSAPFAAYNSEHVDAQLHLRIGVSAGEPVEERQRFVRIDGATRFADLCARAVPIRSSLRTVVVQKMEGRRAIRARRAGCAERLRECDRGVRGRVAVAGGVATLRRRHHARGSRVRGGTVVPKAGRQQQKRPRPASRAFLLLRGCLTMTYFRAVYTPHYHRRAAVSLSCSGWEGVGSSRLRSSGVEGCLTMTYFRTGAPYYHRRAAVSRSCSGWEGWFQQAMVVRR